MEFFSVRMLIHWERRNDQKLKHVYEERITVWEAKNSDEAFELAGAEALEYVADSNDVVLDFGQAYVLTKPIGGHGLEVFSLLRQSDLDPKDYIKAFFSTGFEHQQN
jgi:hypothetical protein